MDRHIKRLSSPLFSSLTSARTQSHDTADSAPSKNRNHPPDDGNAAQKKANECVDLPTQSLGEYLDSCSDVEEGACSLTQWLSSPEDPWHAIDVVYGIYEGIEGMAGTELSASNAGCARSACGR